MIPTALHVPPPAKEEWQRLQKQLRSLPPQPDAWQAWREEGGRWVPDGWIKPGFYADPPAFEPRPGERLKTPAFEARCFQAAAEIGPIDVVIPLGTSSRHGDAELRYALRSIERHLENLGRVWIVGHRPAWIRGVEHVPCEDRRRSKDRNIIHKIEAACRAGVSERFVFWSDDQIFLRPLAFLQLGPYTWGPVHERNGRDGRWHRRLAVTRDWLHAEGFAAFHCDTHVPIPMERERLLELAELSRDCWDAHDGLTVGTWYVNGAEVQPQPMGHRKATIEAAVPAEQLRRKIAGRWFLGFNDAGFTPELRALLNELFPEPSRFECQPTICVKPAGPTLSIIIPTIGRPTLKRTLESIRVQQLVDGDEVIVVQDGPSDLAVWATVKASGLPVRYLATGERAGDAGHSATNCAMPEARGDYLLRIDDDDRYVEGAFRTIRSAIARHPDRPLMFRMERLAWADTLWRQQALRPGNVGTPMFVTPNQPDRLGKWGPYRAGDFAFFISTMRRWPTGSLIWQPETIAIVPRSGMPNADSCPVLKNLIYHVYAHAGNEEWRHNVMRLARSWHLFTGLKIVGIVTDAETVDPEKVKSAFPADPSIEWLVQPNDPERGETVTFLPAARRLESFNSLEATFYAHAKGVSPRFQQMDPDVLRCVRRWRDFMYRFCLEEVEDLLDDVLRRYTAAGCLRSFRIGRPQPGRPPWSWEFAGTFWWLNHAQFFSHPDSLTIGATRHGLEKHLGEFVAPEDACCLAADHIEHHLARVLTYRWPDELWDRLEEEALQPRM